MINEKIICKNKEQTSLYLIISHKNSLKSLTISMEQAKESKQKELSKVETYHQQCLQW